MNADMDEERQKKIEIGKLELAKFQKRNRKNSKTKVQSSNPCASPAKSPCSNFSSRETDVTDGSANVHITNLKEELGDMFQETKCKSDMESVLTSPEYAGEDVDPLLNAEQAALVSCFEDKLVKYQDAVKQKDLIIQQLSQQLASAMSATESSDLARIKVEDNLRAEIDLLHLQIKEAAEMIAKQNSKEESKDYQTSHMKEIPPRLIEISIQTENLCDKYISGDHNFVSESSVISYSSKQSHVPSLKDTSINHHFKHTVDSLSLKEKINFLSIITRLIESHVHNSSQSINESADFSPSKFQSFYLRRLNSSETNQGPLESFENENQMTDINYVDSENGSFQKNKAKSSPIEKFRSHIVPKDISIVTDFLSCEMENINSSFQTVGDGCAGDVPSLSEPIVSNLSEIKPGDKLNFDSTIHEILQQKSQLETKILQLKQMDKELLLERPRQKSIESDTLTAFEDTLIMEEPPLSCVSLLSLTDSEYKTENMTTDSEANISRKVSVDSSRLLQDRDFCANCDKFYELVTEKYDDHWCLLKEAIESNIAHDKNEELKRLEAEIVKLKVDIENLCSEKEKQVELLCQEQELKIEHITRDYDDKLKEFKNYQIKLNAEKENLVQKIKDLELEISQMKNDLHEAWNQKANVEIMLQKQIADLIEEHQEDLEARNLSNMEQISQEKKKLESEYQLSLETLKKQHVIELENLQIQLKQELQEKEIFKEEHASDVTLLKLEHSEECAALQKRIDQLLDEKCESYSKISQEYETLLKRNHKILVSLCNKLRQVLSFKKRQIAEDSCKSINNDIDESVSDALDEVNKNIEEGIVHFLNQNFFSTSDYSDIFEETQYLSLEAIPASYERIQNQAEKDLRENNSIEEKKTASIDAYLGPEDVQLIREEARKFQEEFQKDVAVYIEVNEQLHREIKVLKNQNEQFTDQIKKLESELLEKEKTSEIVARSSGSAKNRLSGPQLSSPDFRCWQVDVAETNSRLMHVLSDLVKTFLAIEQDINRHLYELGLTTPRSNTLGRYEDEPGHSVGSREDFASLSFGECPNLELAEDGPDLTPRAWDVFSAVGPCDNETEEDVVLGASRRLRQAVDNVLNLLTRALDSQQNQDLKLLLKRNEELSQDLQNESKCRDAVHFELVTAESKLRKCELEKQKLEHLVTDLKENVEALQREIVIERNKINYLTQEKEAANDEIQTLKNQCELLASRLGDPEKKLLQENSRLSSEKHTVQISLSMERQSYLDRMQQMEIALDNLNAEKEEIMENKCKEIRDLKAEMEAMEKQLQSNKKFIDEQAQEREQEREDYLKELSKMQELLREKEKIQSNEARLMKEIESLEQNLQMRIEDHQNAMQKKRCN